MDSHTISLRRSPVSLALSLLLAISLGACSGGDQTPLDPSPVEETAAPDFEDDFQEMVSVLSLTTDEQAALRVAFDARLAELTEWLEGPKGDALRAEEKALREAVETKDLAAVRAISRQGKTQRARFGDAVEQTEADIRAALSPEKLSLWDGHIVAKKMLEVMADLALDSDQQDAIRSNAASSVDAATRAGEPNPMAAGYMNLEQWVEKRVLTPTQREAFQAIKQKKPMRTMGF